MIARLFLAGAATLALTGCLSGNSLGVPKTLGEQAANYGYVPLDPLPVNQAQDADSCKELPSGKSEPVPLLDALPDLAIRFAVADVDASGGLAFGPSKLTTEGGTYRAVLDYINVDEVPADFLVRKSIGRPGFAPGFEGPNYKPDPVLKEYVVKYDVLISSSTDPMPDKSTKFERVTIPVYIGVGLRLSADIRSLKGNVNLSGLGVIGAQAEANALSGTLTVQTLGVNGASLATSLPLPNKLDQTTVEAGILAIGTSRAMLYTAGVSGTAAEKIIATPRVVGLYSPIGSDPAFINAVYAELSRARLKWNRPCRLKSAQPTKPELTAPKGGFTIEAKP